MFCNGCLAPAELTLELYTMDGMITVLWLLLYLKVIRCLRSSVHTSGQAATEHIMRLTGARGACAQTGLILPELQLPELLLVGVGAFSTNVSCHVNEWKIMTAYKMTTQTTVPMTIRLPSFMTIPLYTDSITEMLDMIKCGIRMK